MTDGVIGLPTGVVTFLFTDVEGSTALWAADSDAMAASLAVHDEILRDVVATHDGYVFTTAGDSFAVAFQAATSGVAAAIDAQRRLGQASWPGPALRIRIGVHLGEAVERGGDYFGPTVNLTARLEAAGHGGQILISEAVQQAAGVVDTVALGSHQLRDVPDPVEIHQVGAGEFAALRIAGTTRTNLPVAPARLIGRDRELAVAREALETSRLVTLAAAGGTGKTRLALAVGEALLNHQRGGVWFVDLTTVTREEDVATAVASVLDLQVSGDPVRHVAEYLSGLDALLLLDNCEHVVDACADLLEMFLRTPGSSRVLATTREYFDIDGERAIRLSALDSEGTDSPGVELFIERALATDGSIQFDEDDRTTISQLCAHLDGSPLAIELAASRCGVMSPPELLAALGERFELLRGGRRRRSRQALEDTLDWSYDLLDEDEQRLFRLLSVFSGSFDSAATAAVADLRASEAVDLLESLTAKSLVLSDRVDGATRFRLLETPSAYAERLAEEHAEAEDARTRHLDHFLAVTDRYVVGSMPTIASLAVAADRANILSAIEWAQVAQRWQDAARLMFGTYEMLCVQADVVSRVAKRTLEHEAEIPGPDDGRARGAVIGAAVQLDDFETATELVVGDFQSDDPVRRASAADAVAWLTKSSGDQAGALEQIAAAREILSSIDDPTFRLQAGGRLEVNAAWSHAQLGDFERCLERLQVAREMHDGLEYATSYTSMGLFAEAVAHAELGDLDQALAVASELDAVATVFAKPDDARIIAYLRAGDYESAMPMLKEQALDAATGRLSRAANDTLLFLTLLAEEDDPELARRRLMPVEQTRTPATIAAAMAAGRRLGVAEAFGEAQDRGRADRVASGRRAVDALRSELTVLGWS